MTSVPGTSASGIYSAPISGLDIETALMAVQSKRAELLETQLKGQLEEVQARNQQMAKLNETLSSARRVQSGFKSDAKSTSKINDNVKEGRTKNVKSHDDAIWIVEKNNKERGQALRNFIENGEPEFTPKGFLEKIALDSAKNTWPKAKEDFAKGIGNPRADNFNALKTAWEAAGLAEFNLVDKGQLDTSIENIKSMIDSLSNSQQMDMLRLQSLSNKRNEAFDVMTNFIKKMQESRSSIINSIR